MKAMYRAIVPQRWRARIRAWIGRMDSVYGVARGVKAVSLYIKYRRELERYRELPGAGEIESVDLWPCLFDKTAESPIPAHYFYQAAWAARRIVDLRPAYHIDVGSQIELIGILSAVVPVAFIDIRPLSVSISNVNTLAGSILSLPLASSSIKSLSCLHVIEHVGLGRYGDPFDTSGTEKAAKELSRVLAVEGNLFLSMPVGRERTCFNAHRVHSPETILRYFGDLKLVEFSCEDDMGRFRQNANPKEFTDASYACGMFWFTKK